MQMFKDIQTLMNYRLVSVDIDNGNLFLCSTTLISFTQSLARFYLFSFFSQTKLWLY